MDVSKNRPGQKLEADTAGERRAGLAVARARDIAHSQLNSGPEACIASQTEQLISIASQRSA